MEHQASIIAAALVRFLQIYIGIFLISIALVCFKRTTSFEFGRRFTLFLVTGIVPTALSPFVALLGARPGLPALAAAAPAALLIYYVVRHFGRWIIFNVNAAELEVMIEDSLEDAGIEYEQEGPRFKLGRSGGGLTVSFQPVLHYAIIHLDKEADPAAVSALERRLREKLVNLEARPLYLEGGLFFVIGAMCFLGGLF